MLKYDVLCVGSATVDRFLTAGKSLKKIRVGDKVLVTDIETHSGGGATNSAAAFSKLGLKVKMLTKLGDDENADYILKSMKKYKVKNICIKSSNKRTDTAVIISSVEERDRIIYVHKGASRDLQYADFKNGHLIAKWIYLASLVGKSFTTAKKIAIFAKQKKIKVLFNPSLYLAQKGKKYLKSVLDATTVIVLNKEEAQVLLGSKATSFPVLLRSLSKLGPSTVVITNGTKRFYALHENIIYSLMPPIVPRVHTAGAGDAFTAGLLSEIIKGHHFSEAMKLGQANASSIIQHIGTKNKLLTRTEAHKLIKKYKITCRKV
jgi:sugar/nucleoside kinase (ribokinase family)